MNTDERAALKAELRLEIAAENDREEFEAAFWSELREEYEEDERQRFEGELPGIVEESIDWVRKEQEQVLESQWRVYISDSE